MPRVLLITFCYPPTQVIGSVRPAGLVKYLSRFGWDSIVLTPKVKRSPGDPSIVETEYRDVVATWKKRLGLDGKRSVHQQLRLPVSSKPRSELWHTRALEMARYFITYPDEAKGWVPFALRAVEEMAEQGLKFDAILTTSPPISSHLIGRKAKKILGCPWVADFRDLWTQNMSNPHPRLEAMQTGLERRTLKDADALVAVSQPWAERLQRSYPSKRVFAITNGFDPDQFASLSGELTAKFTITYAGLLYQGRRDPAMLFETLRELFDQKLMSPEDVEVRFYGTIEPWVAAQVQQYRLDGVVQLPGLIARAEALQRQAESQILLMLGWTDPRETGQHSGKLFEYLGAGRPILAVGGGPSVLTETLKETGAGMHAFSRDEVRKFLMDGYQEFKTRGRVSYHGIKPAIERYTHFHMARHFSEVLNLVSGASPQTIEDKNVVMTPAGQSGGPVR